MPEFLEKPSFPRNIPRKKSGASDPRPTPAFPEYGDRPYFLDFIPEYSRKKAARSFWKAFLELTRIEYSSFFWPPGGVAARGIARGACHPGQSPPRGLEYSQKRGPAQLERGKTMKKDEEVEGGPRIRTAPPPPGDPKILQFLYCIKINWFYIFYCKLLNK